MSNGSVRHRRSCGRRESSKKGKDDGRHHRTIERTKANTQPTNDPRGTRNICMRLSSEDADRLNGMPRGEERRVHIHTTGRPLTIDDTHGTPTTSTTEPRTAPDPAPSASRLRTQETPARPQALFHPSHSPIEQPTARTHARTTGRTSNARDGAPASHAAHPPESISNPSPSTPHRIRTQVCAQGLTNGRMNGRKSQTNHTSKGAASHTRVLAHASTKGRTYPRVEPKVHFRPEPSKERVV